MAQVKMLMLSPKGNAGAMAQLTRVPVVVGVCVTALPRVSTTVLGEKDTVGFAMRTLRFSAADPDPVLFVAVIVKPVGMSVASGVPVMAQVVVLMLRPKGSMPTLMEQFVMVPVIVGVCVAALPMVSTNVLGEKDTVGLASRTVKFKLAMADPVLFEAVIV